MKEHLYTSVNKPTLMGLLHTSGYSQQPSCYKNCTRNCIRNKTFLFGKIETWNFMIYNFVRFHKILNHTDSENFKFLSWQTSFVPNAIPCAILVTWRLLRVSRPLPITVKPLYVSKTIHMAIYWRGCKIIIDTLKPKSC